MASIEITSIAHLLDLTAAYGDLADDYDRDAVEADFLTAIQERAPEGVTLFANGEVHATLDAAGRAREIDWAELVDGIDVAAILERHDLTALFDVEIDGILLGYDERGELLVAFGPDLLDENGQQVEASDEYWIGTLYSDGEIGATTTGTRAEVIAQARRWGGR